MNEAWIARTCAALLALRASRPGWSYRPDGEPYVEPTVLAALALAAAGELAGPQAPAAITIATDWLAALQQPDGSLGLASSLSAPHWTTALGVWLWSAAGGHSNSVERATAWLIAQRGSVPNEPSTFPVGHDARIPGWPWVEGTHAWLEPTAFAVLALRRAGLGEHERTRDGQRLIRDRAIRSGGWNYGNSTVFGADLRAQPAPTGLALLALAGDDDAEALRVDRGCAWLESILPTTHAALSLCWGLLALTAWNRRPAQAADWLAAASERTARRSDPAVQMAYLVLGACPRTLELIGASKHRGRSDT